MGLNGVPAVQYCRLLESRHTMTAMEESIRNLKSGSSKFRASKSSVVWSNQSNSLVVENAVGESLSAKEPNSLIATTIESIREVRKEYLFGLLQISQLQDLEKAPDAIMPGNFCSTENAYTKSKE